MDTVRKHSTARDFVPGLMAASFVLIHVNSSAFAEGLNLDDPKGAVLEFMMLPVEDRFETLKKLARNGDPRTGPFFAEVLASEDKELVTEEAILEDYVLPNLSVFASPRDLDPIRKASRSENARLKRYAALALGYSGAPQAAEDLKGLLGDEDDFVRRNAIRGLCTLGTKEAAEALDAHAKSTKNQEERDAATKALARVNANLARRHDLPAPYPPDLSTVTPHTAWAKPLPKKPRVLFLLERAILRDFVEVNQRVDMDWDYVDIPCSVLGKGKGDLHLLEIRDDIRDVVLDRLDRPWDAIVVLSILQPGRHPNGHTVKDSRGPVGWLSFPEEVQRGILKKVAAGTGLVLIDGGPDRIAGVAAVLPGNRSLLPWPKDARAEQFGKGRIARFSRGTEAQTWGSVVLDIRRLVPLPPEFQVPAIPGKTRQIYPSEDFYFHAVGRAILWAAGHDFPTRIQEVTLAASQGEPGKVTCRLDGERVAGATVAVDILDAYHRVLHHGQALFDPPQVEIPVPPLPGGGVVLGARILDADGRVMDWAGFLGSVRGTARIESVTPPTPPVAASQPIHAAIRLSGDVPDGAVLEAEAVDQWGRLVGRCRSQVNASKAATLHFQNHRVLSKVITLAVVLQTAKGQPLFAIRQPVVVRQEEDYRDVPWINWGADAYIDLWRRLGPNHVSHLALETLEAGIDVATPGFSGPVPVHDSGPYSPDGVRRPCLTSAKWELQVENAVRDNIAEYVALNCRLYLLSDETSLGGDYCFSPTCIEAFRSYLKDDYPSLDALNKSWNTSYKDWQDVLPMRFKDLKDTSHPGPWFDHAAFQDLVYTGMYGRVQTLLRSHIPDARAGSSTTETRDQWVFARRQGLAALFVSIRYRHEEASFRPDDQLLGGWFRPGYQFGALEDEAGTFYWGWDQILHGTSAIITWIGSYGFDYPMVRGDLAADAILRNTKRLADDIRSGYGRLFLGAKRRAGDYAIYYSPRSELLDQALAQAGPPIELKPAHRFRPCYDLDQIFRFPRVVAYAEVLMGYLRRSPPQILYLPLIRCLSDREIEEIKSYVREGGLLIATADPGLRDEHGVPRPDWPLGEVFGLKRKPAGRTPPELTESAPVEVVAAVENIDLTDLRCNLQVGKDAKGQPVVAILDDVESAGAKPMFRVAGIPAGYVHPFGKGLAIYLNLDPVRLAFAEKGEKEKEKEKEEPYPNPHQVILERIFTARNLRRGYEVEWDHGHPMVAGRPGHALAEFRDTTGRYLALIRTGTGSLQEQPREKVTIRIDEPACAYDARAGKFLGEDRAFRFEFGRGPASFLSLLPYQVKAIEVQATPGTPGRIAEVTGKVVTDRGTPRRHVIAFRAYRPDGTEAVWFRKNIDTPDGAFRHELPVAMNEVPGTWRIVLRDVATGLEKETALTVTTSVEGGK